MLSKWPIRVKFLMSLALLLLCVAILAGSGLLSTHRYRSIVKGLSARSKELPPAKTTWNLCSRMAVASPSTYSQLTGSPVRWSLK